MLPLDNLSEAATRALVDHGLSPDEMSVALQLDLDFDGNFGESWLIYCQSTHSLIRLLADADSITTTHRRITITSVRSRRRNTWSITTNTRSRTSRI